MQPVLHSLSFQGGEVDFVSAFKFFETAAKQLDPSAQYGLAYMYLTGQGAAEDHEKAYKLFVQVRGVCVVGF